MAYISRRRFLAGMGQAALITGVSLISIANAKERPGPKIGLALGSGGASGLAHILVIETLEELGLKPACISGSSIGAIAGAFVASGHDAKSLRSLVAQLAPEDLGSWLGQVFKKDRVSLLDMLKIDMDSAGLVNSEAFQSFLLKQLGKERFEDLEIPLVVTATDFWEREMVVFGSGPLIPPVMASAALPGIFPPVRHEGKLLVDGGLVNPVPYDLIIDRAEITIAVNVLGTRPRPEDDMPGYLDLVFNTFDIMQANVIHNMLKNREPSIYLEPPVTGIRVLDFHKAESIYNQALPVKDDLKRQLEKLIKG